MAVMPKAHKHCLLTVGFALSLVGAAPPVQAVPPPVEQFSADCTAPTYASDQLMCDNAELLALDRQMQGALQRAGQAASDPSSALVESQSAWFRRRSMCAMQREHAECLRQAYGERLAVLQGLASGAPATGTSWRCGKVDANQAVELREAGYGAVVLDQGGRVSAVAVAVARGNGRWQPFLKFVRKGKKASIVPLGGRPTTCTRIGN